jgi:fructokinase
VIFGGIEAGGTKWVCAVGTGPDDLQAIVTIPTTTPGETIDRVVEFFASHPEVAAIGVGSFGPLDLDERSSRFGAITTTPKPGWGGTEVRSLLASKLGVPISIETDVAAAALGEGRFGAAQGLETFCYITVGTGIGGGAVIRGKVAHGLLHPEFGHMRIPHDQARDPFPGSCPYHGDCFEGLASGQALQRRFGVPAHELRAAEAWALEADYVALGLVNVICTLSPERIVLGGGVINAPGLLQLVHERVQILAGDYFDTPALREGIVDYIVRPALGDRAGVVGGLELARARLGSGEARGDPSLLTVFSRPSAPSLIQPGPEGTR